MNNELLNLTILGIDPGFRITGFGLVRVENKKLIYLNSGRIRTTYENLAERLQQIYAGIREMVARYQPQEISIEQVFMHQNPGSALKLGQARGVAIVAASQEGLPVFEYSARQVKQAVVGYGAAQKNQIQQMVCHLLNLKGSLSPDAADALAIAVCHAHTRMNFLPVQKIRQGRMR